ncbi:MAG: hypothetical protein WAL26_19870 [Mycobacterium sp.]
MKTVFVDARPRLSSQRGDSGPSPIPARTRSTRNVSMFSENAAANENTE